jgi:hypothetical protein
LPRSYFVNFRIATPNGTEDTVAEICNVVVGRQMRMVAVHGKTLSDFISGRKIANLSPILATKGITKENAAQIAVDRLIAQHGDKPIIAALRIAPKLNALPSTQTAT